MLPSALNEAVLLSLVAVPQSGRAIKACRYDVAVIGGECGRTDSSRLAFQQAQFAAGLPVPHARRAVIACRDAATFVSAVGLDYTYNASVTSTPLPFLWPRSGIWRPRRAYG